MQRPPKRSGLGAFRRLRCRLGGPARRRMAACGVLTAGLVGWAPLARSTPTCLPPETRPVTTSPARNPRVLVLHAYDAAFTWTNNVTRGVRDVFAARAGHVELCFEYMDVKRVYSEAYFDRLREFLAQKYAGRRIDAIVCSDDQALDFMTGRGQTIWPGVPIVFCGVNDYDPQVRRRGLPITGVVESIDIQATLNVALRLQPDTREVVVITDRTRTGRALREDAEAVFAGYQPQLRFRYLEHLTMRQLQDEVAGLTPGTIVFAFIFSQDRHGRVFSHEYNLQRLVSRCPVAIYSVWEFYLGHGIVGGMLTRGQAHGAAAAEMALRVLGGQRAADIPVVTRSPNCFMFDHAQLTRFGIPESRLPAECTIVNRPVSLLRRYRWLILGGAAAIGVLLAAVAALTVSIARRHRAERALRDSETALRSIFRAAPIGIGLVVEREIQRVNDSFCRMLGRTPEELIDRSARVLYPDDAEFERVGREKYQQIAEEGTGTIETRMVHRDGRVLDVLLSSTPLDPADPSAGVTFTALDITHRKALEAQLRQSQKMEAIGRLAGGVAHDFNNQLTVIQGMSDLLLDGLADGDRQRELVEEILAASERARSLTERLLAFSHRQALRTEVVEVHDVLSRMRVSLGRMLGEDIELTVEAAPGTSRIEVDPSQLEQALMNLAVNARDAMPRGGRLTIEAADAELDETYTRHHPEVRPGQYVLLAVSDTGCGMEPQTRERAFEPFFTTKEVGKGTGLGLSMVYGFVRQSDGSMSLYSEPGRGTTVRLYFPVCSDAPTRPGLERPAAIVGGNETVLVAEDEKAVRQFIVRVLGQLGYSVLEAASAREALPLGGSHEGPIHALVTDVVMPGGDGIELAERLREIRPEMRVLYISGYAEHAAVRNGHVRPDSEFLSKPFKPDDLAVALRRLLDAAGAEPP